MESGEWRVEISTSIRRSPVSTFHWARRVEGWCGVVPPGRVVGTAMFVRSQVFRTAPAARRQPGGDGCRAGCQNGLVKQTRQGVGFQVSRLTCQSSAFVVTRARSHRMTGAEGTHPTYYKREDHVVWRESRACRDGMATETQTTGLTME